MTEVVPIDDDLVDGAAGAVAGAFADNEIWVWMLGPSRRWAERVLARYYRAMIRHVYAPRGAAWTTPGALGAALWLPPGTQELGVVEQVREIVALLPEGATCLRRGARFDRMTHEHRPAQPHWYLHTLAVSPEAQGAGVGSALLRRGLADVDRAGRGAYLETQRRTNIPFYRRFGFEEVERIALDDSPPVWTMWRPPA